MTTAKRSIPEVSTRFWVTRDRYENPLSYSIWCVEPIHDRDGHWARHDPKRIGTDVRQICSRWMLRTHGDRVDHICLPMRYEKDAMPKPTSLDWTDPRVTPGELLWPAAISEESVADKERQLGPHAEGQLQQRPPTRSLASMFHATYFDDNTIWFDEFPPENEVRCKVVACDPKGSALAQPLDHPPLRLWLNRDPVSVRLHPALRPRELAPRRDFYFGHDRQWGRSQMGRHAAQ
jgi:hypothetical protein